MASGYYPIILIPNLHQSVVGDGFRIYGGTTRQNPPHPPQIPRILKWEEAWARRLRNKGGLLGLTSVRGKLKSPRFRRTKPQFSCQKGSKMV